MKSVSFINLSKSKIHLFIMGLNNIYLVLFFVVVNYFLSISFGVLSKVVSGDSVSTGFPSLPVNRETVVLLLVVAPVVETLIFQTSLIEWLRTKLPLPICCVISALAFASTHVYNVYYFFFTFLSGLLLAYLYTLKKTMLAATVITVVGHLLYNALVFAIKNFL